MSYRTDTFRIAMAGPADLSGLVNPIDSGELDARHIVAILAKTEGNGGVTARASDRVDVGLYRGVVGHERRAQSVPGRGAATGVEHEREVELLLARTGDDRAHRGRRVVQRHQVDGVAERAVAR